MKSVIHHLRDEDLGNQVRVGRCSCKDPFHDQISGFSLTIKLDELYFLILHLTSIGQYYVLFTPKFEVKFRGKLDF